MKPSTSSLYRKVWGPFIEQAVESYIPDSPAWEVAQEMPLDPKCSHPAAPVQPGVTPTQDEFSWWPCLPDPQASLTRECLAKGFGVSVPPPPFSSCSPRFPLAASHTEVIWECVCPSLLPSIRPPSPFLFSLSSIYSLCIEHKVNTQVCSMLFNPYRKLPLLTMIK